MENMTTVQIGSFPGRLDSYVLEVGTTVGEALEIASLTVGAEQSIKVDGEVVDASFKIAASTGIILLTKRLKGAVA